jgi:diguanylate cyclase (GGDEF)-like protein
MMIIIEEDFINIDEKGTKSKKKKNNMMVLLFRWVFLLFITVLTLPAMNIKTNGYALLETLAVAVIYNGAITAYTLKIGQKASNAASIILYLDIIIMSIFSFFSGGINSDVYIFIFFLLGYCGIFNDASYTIKLGIFCAVIYSVSCVLSARVNGEEIVYIRLFIKNMLFIMETYGISRINYEVRKHDELRKKEFKLARTDKLTGLANRHYFDQKLQEEVDYSLANNATLNVLIFDLDNFKGFNDTYGHLSGDKLLMLFSDIIRQCIRKSDIPVRYGGEEFLILIRDLDIFIAKSVGERIRRQLEKQRIYLGDQNNKKRVTVSCGVAQYPLHSRNIKQVIELADQALYHAKEIGKNIVITYDEIGQGRETAGE